jgi:signal transduction histidine kinase
VFLLPQSEISPLFRDLDKPDCKTLPSLSASGRADEKKALQWLEYRCGKKPLDPKFFAQLPLHHPYGGSWAWFAAQNSPDFASREWLLEQAKHRRLHVVEAAHLLQESFPSGPRIASLRLMDLGVMLNGQTIVIGEHEVFVADARNQRLFHVHPASTWREIEAGSLLKLVPEDPQGCIAAEIFSCWAVNKRYVWQSRLNIAAFVILTLALLFGFIYKLIRERRLVEIQAAADRQLLVQTLAHELRHPVTGLRLSLETFRDHFDDLSDGLKEEFLRMTGQTQKLQRLIHASQQYLQTDSTEGPFKFKWTRLESFNDFFEDLLENYREKIEIGPLEKDSPMVVDAYWLGMCVTNLVKNALIHGQKPIAAKARIVDGRLEIEVSDSGPGIPANQIARRLSGQPQDTTSENGMGLGLSLVVRIVRLMGGRIDYSREPRSTFTITLEARHEVHPDRRG